MGIGMDDIRTGRRIRRRIAALLRGRPSGRSSTLWARSVADLARVRAQAAGDGPAGWDGCGEWAENELRAASGDR
jgi:hypothetical protein